MTRPAVLALSLALAGCGYHLAHAPADPLGPFTVTGGRVRVPDVQAVAAAEEGARAELSRAGALGPGGGVIEVEVLRVDETSEGIALDVAGSPFARGVRVTVTARAVLRRAGSAAVERDSGDVRASEVAARADGAVRGMVVGGEAARAAARRAGEAAVRRLLGYPEPSEP
jgi:hypothetical protein